MLLPSLRSFRENLAIKDILFTGAPTAGTYTGYLNGYLNSVLPDWLVVNPWLTLTITLSLFLIVLFILYYFNYESRKKYLAEVLATGYYLNFSGKLTSLLKESSEITFFRSSDSVTIPINKVKLAIFLPDSKETLESISSEIEESSEIAYVRYTSFSQPSLWLRIQENTTNGEITIVEFPRTLFALPHYLSTEYTNRTAKKLLQSFNKKFRQLVSDNPDKRPPASRFEIR